MPRRLIVHAGFHKTGTTSIQRLLKRNRNALPDMQIILRPHMIGLCEAARAYSVSRDAVDLGFVQYEAALLAETMRRDTILLSSEDLSGHMPGRHNLKAYDAAPALAAAMTEAWDAALPGVEVSFAYTTRDAGPWLASCYAQHLRATRITIAADHYALVYAGSADLTGIVAQVQGALPDVNVRHFALEDTGGARLGPADALLACAGVPADQRATLTPVARANRGLSRRQRDALLALNQSTLTDTELRERKSRLT
ncbi:hypothetical protein [uncultured Tateyamaria sp.]|uniref:hypothetical protein n=1 Tax=Tateyamaria sp. 1078 TaxID=3417464 RepID=UPI002619E4CD|nr:hypothetical protein [uncultured Tateyamaria sp.]